MDAPIDVFAFDDIRPYNDAELKEALARLVEEDSLYKMMRWVYPGLSKASIRKMFLSIENIQQFQEEITHAFAIPGQSLRTAYTAAFSDKTVLIEVPT